MTAKRQTEVERLAALIDRKLKALERQKKPPSLAELNATRRLIEWVNRERQLEQAKELVADQRLR